VWEEMAQVQKLTDELSDIKIQLQQLRTEPSGKPRDAAPLPPATASPVTPSAVSGKASDVKPLLPKPPRPTEQRPAASATTKDVHGWLSGRVEAIQKERDSRWQKIFSLLGGSSPPAR
jgi:hypothetical protein